MILNNTGKETEIDLADQSQIKFALLDRCTMLRGRGEIAGGEEKQRLNNLATRCVELVKLF